MDRVLSNIIGFIGGMGSNKSTLLVNYCGDPRYPRGSVILFYRQGTNRSHGHSSRSKARFKPSIAIERPRDILRHITPETRLVAIDEAHFWSRSRALELEMQQVFLLLTSAGIDVAWAAIQFDFRCVHFAIVEWLLGRTTDLRPMSNRCAVCGQPGAVFAQKDYYGHPAPITAPRFEVDNPSAWKRGVAYRAVCRSCHRLPLKADPGLLLIRRNLRKAATQSRTKQRVAARKGIHHSRSTRSRR